MQRCGYSAACSWTLDNSRQPTGWREFVLCSGGLSAHGCASFALTLLGLVLVTFAMTRLSPVDPALQMVGDHASQSTYEATPSRTRARPAAARAVSALSASKLASGNLGQSHLDRAARRVATSRAPSPPRSSWRRRPSSLGAIDRPRARHPCRACGRAACVDAMARIVSLFGYSVPIFWLGLLMLLLFYARLHWAPGPGSARRSSSNTR